MNNLTNIAIFGLSLVLLFFSFMGNHGYLHLKKIDSELEKFNSKNSELALKVSSLQNKINSLKNSDYAVEKAAREELGLAKPQEVIYIFSEAEPIKNNLYDAKKEHP